MSTRPSGAVERLNQRALSVSVYMEMASNETIKQAVMAGLGVSLLSLHTLMLEMRSQQMARLDVIGTPIERTWHIVHMRHKPLSPACQAFRAFLLDETAPFLEAACAGMLPSPQRA